MNYLKNLHKYPQSESNCGTSMLVNHAPTENVALNSQPVDLGLKPNGLTLDDMQANAKFNRTGDLLDKAAVASKESSELSKENKATIDKLKALEKKSKHLTSNN